jgi:hypothetical protein
MEQLRRANNKIRIICTAVDSCGLADESLRVNYMALPRLVERDDSTSGEAVIRRMSV